MLLQLGALLEDSQPESFRAGGTHFFSEISNLWSPKILVAGFLFQVEQPNTIIHSDHWHLTIHQSTEM